MLSSKTISEFQQEFTSVGAEKVEKELRSILSLLETLRRAQSTLLSDKAGDGAISVAKSTASNAQQEISLRQQRLKTIQSIDRIEGDLARRHIERQNIKSKADEQYEKDFQKLLAEEETAKAKSQTLFNQRMEKESAAEVKRIAQGRARSKEYLAFQDEERKAYARGVELEAIQRQKATKIADDVAKKLQGARDAIRQSRIRTGDIVGEDLGSTLNITQRSPLPSSIPVGDAVARQLSEGQRLQAAIEVRGKAIQMLTSKERETRELLGGAINSQSLSDMDKYQSRLSSLASGSKELANQTRNMTSRLREWEQEHTLMGWITNFWNKFQTVFVRVVSALLSFEVIRVATTLVAGFFRAIIDSNAQLEVLDARLRLMTKDGGTFNALKQRIIDLTVTTPFIIKNFIDASVSLQAFGINSVKYLKPVADWATAIGRDLDDVSIAFAKIASGSPRTALLLTTRGISKTDFDRELSQTGDRLLALSNVIEKRFGGMAERVSQTFTGFISNIKDAWFILSAAVGKDLFTRLRQDVAITFGLMKGEMSETSFLVNALSKSLGIAYDIIKVAFGAGTLLLISRVAMTIVELTKLVWQMISAWGTYEAMEFWGKHAILKKVVDALTNSYVKWALAVSAVALAMVDINQKQKDYEKSVLDSDKAMSKSGSDSEAYINSLEKQKEALKNRYSGLFYDIGRFFLPNLVGDPLDRRIEAETNRLTGLQARSQEMLNLRARENALLDEQLSLLEKISTKKEIEGKIGGNEARSLMMREIADALSGGVSLSELPNRPMGESGNKLFFADLQKEAHKYGIELQSVGAELYNINKLYNLNQDNQTFDITKLKRQPVDLDYAKKLVQVQGFLTESLKTNEQLEKEALDSIPERVREFRKSLKDSDNVQEKFTEWFKGLPDIVKTAMVHAGKSVRDYTDEIAALREELARLNAGEGKASSRIAGERERVRTLETAKPIGIVMPDLSSLAEERLKPFEEYFQKASQATGVEVGVLKAIAQQETARWKAIKDITTAGSNKGARGIMQLLPGTFKEQGVGSDIFDPLQNIMAGAKYFAKMLDKFKGDFKLALAAYNAGPGAVINAGLTIPNIAETKTYVDMISESLGISESEGKVISGNIAKAAREYELLKAKVQLKKDEITLDAERNAHDAKMVELQTRQLELTIALGQNKVELAKRTSELQFEFDPSATELRVSRLRDIADLEKQILDARQLAESSTADSVNSMFAAMMSNDVSEYQRLSELSKEQQTQSLQEQSKLVGLQTKIVELRKLILSDPSTSVAEGIGKAIRKLKVEIETFWDSLAELTISSVRDFTKSIVVDLIFGNADRDKFDQQIADARLELQKLNEDKQRDFNRVNQFRRVEGETNDEYLQRTQRLSEIQGQQADVYTYQTKELELLAKINELEQQRNNIILDRLKSLGQKVFDKFLDFGLNSLFASLSGDGGGYDPDTSGTGGLGRPSGGGGVKSPALANVGRINPILVEPSIQNIANRRVENNSVLNKNVFDNRTVQNIVNRTIQNNSSAIQNVANKTFQTTSSMVQNLTNRVFNSASTLVRNSNLDNRSFRSAVDNSSLKNVLTNTSLRTSLDNRSFKEFSDSRVFSNVRNERSSASSNVNNARYYNTQSKGDTNYSLHINGDVYGEDDFTKKVDSAFKSISRQRTR